MSVQILDGAIGTELGARGLMLEAPDWSARAMEKAPALLSGLHADYADAGATLHTANTFRTQPRAMGTGWREGLEAALRIARSAVPPGHQVLGSMAPVEDCYRTDLSPGAASRAEHREVARALAKAGCDRILCETFAHREEAIVAAEEAMDTGLPVWLSLTAGPFGELASPAGLARIGAELAPLGIDGLFLNCVAATRIGAYLDAISHLDLPLGVYANAGRPEDGLGWGGDSPGAAAAYADLAEQWRESGAIVIGGCCGTSPMHIHALAERFA